MQASRTSAPRLLSSAALAVLVALALGLAAPAAAAIEFPEVPLVEGVLASPEPPTADALFGDVSRLFRASSRSIVAQVTVLSGRSVHSVTFALWTSGEDRALLRVRGPQRAAGRAVLRIGDAVWAWDPDWGRLETVGPQGERARWGRLLVRIVDVVVGRPLLARFRAEDVRPTPSPGAGWTLSLLARDGDTPHCERLEIDVSDDTRVLLEARCWQEGGARERWRFDRHRDFGGLLLPTEVAIDRMGEGGWSATLQIHRIGLDTPIDEGLFTLTALQALR